MRKLLRLIRDTDGATAVEYAVLLGLILLVVLASVTAVGTQNRDVWVGNQQSIDSAMSGSS